MILIHWKPDKTLKKPVRKQIIDFFIDKIQRGEWPAGALLPAQRELSKLFDVNRSTVVSALGELISRGLLESRGRGGTMIASEALSFLHLSQAKWQTYIDEGIHIPNYNTIKLINDAEPYASKIRLSSGEPSPEIFSKTRMQYVLNEVAKDGANLGYEWPKGMLSLRESLCHYLLTLGIKTTPESILIVSGALQAIQLISIGLLQTGSTVFVEKPSYIYSLQILQTLGMRRVGIEIDQEGIVGSQIPSQIRKSHASILYTIPNYQNPTGVMMTLNRRKQLLEICKKEKLPIIEDDVYGELWIDEKPPLSLKSLDDSGNVLYIGSVSKTLSPGLRIGWVVGPETVINRLADVKMQMDYGSSSLSQLAVAKWLDTGLYQEHLKEMRLALKKRRDFTLQILDLYFKDLATWEKPRGGYYVWLELTKEVSMTRVFELAIGQNILLYPGYIYESGGKKTLRISYSYASFEDIEKGLKALAHIINAIEA